MGGQDSPIRATVSRGIGAIEQDVDNSSVCPPAQAPYTSGMDPAVGALVAPTPKYRATMGTGDGGAVLLATRRGSGQIYYVGTDHMYWVPTRQLGEIPPEVLPDGSRERLLSDILLFLRADECVLDAVDGDKMDISVESPGVTGEAFDQLRADLGPRLARFAFEAGSMRHVLIRLELVSLPPAADTVR